MPELTRGRAEDCGRAFDLATQSGSLRSFLIVSDLIPRLFGGGIRFLTELGRKASVQGIRMGMLLAGEPIPLVADAFRSAGIAWWSLPDWKTQAGKERRWQLIKGFRRINALESWDVVAFEHCTPLSVIAACTWSRVLDGRRFARVWHQHSGIRAPTGVKKYVSSLRLLGPFMDAFVALSEVAARSFQDRRCPPTKVKIICNGVHIPANLSRGWLRPKLGLPESVRLLVTVASLIPRKGLDILLQAVGPLFNECPEWHLVIVGGGPLLAELQESSKRMQMASRIHFLGLSNNALEILADCNIFVLPSRNEAMPVSILEAMALSLPVVATDVGCVRDVVVPGKTGLLVAPEDSEGLCAALRTVFLDENFARQLGAQGRQRVDAVYSLDGQVDGYLNLYRAVCS
jgi:glycosyltransferase involved in cell wall biosynthesis